jgi:phosphate acetyltransferase
MSDFINEVFDRARKAQKTIVLAEGNDERTLEAAEKILEQGFANLIVLGDAQDIASSKYNLEGAQIIDPLNSELHNEFRDLLVELRAHKGMTTEKAEDLVKDPLFFGVLLVKTRRADGMVAGACHATADVLRPSLQILKTAPGAKLVSSFFVMVVPNCEFGQNGTFIFADCGLNVNPNSDELAHIAIDSAKTWQTLIGTEANVAMLGHSTYGSAKNDDAQKVVEAAVLAKELAPDLKIDGEMQADAAMCSSVASSKCPNSDVAGNANVLVFPDLDAGNIGYKLVQRLAKAEAYGPITQGLAAPVNDLSRGCSAEDIVGVVAITALQASLG